MKALMRFVLALLPLGAWAAGIAWLASPEAAPWSPELRLSYSGADFQSADGAERREGDHLIATGMLPGGETVLLLREPPRELAELRYLSFEWEPLPPGLRPLLLWNDSTGTHGVNLPWHGEGGTVDLAQVPGWKAEAHSFGLMFIPLDLAPPTSLEPRRIALKQMRFESVNRRAALDATWTGWTAWRPWTGRSVNTGGFELVLPPKVPAQLGWLSLAAALAIGLAIWRRFRWRRMALAFVLIGWGLLDFAELRQHLWRAVAYPALAESAAQDGRPLAASPTLHAAIAQLQPALRALPAETRVLVFGGDAFSRQYPVFLLREFNVGELPGLAELPADVTDHPTVLVLIGGGDWQFMPASGRLRVGPREWPARALPAAAPLQVYALGPLAEAAR